MGRQQIALAALAHPMLAGLLYPTGLYGVSNAIQVRAQDCEHLLKQSVPDLKDSRADQLMSTAIADVKAMLPEEPADLLQWLLEQPVEVLLNREYVLRALRFGLVQIEVQDPITPVLFSAAGKTLTIMPVHGEVAEKFLAAKKAREIGSSWE